MALLLDRLARAAARHWKRTLAIALAGVVAAGALAAALGGEFADDFSIPGAQSTKALNLLQDRFPAVAGDTATVVFAVPDGRSGTIRDAQRAAAIRAALARIAGQPDVSGVASPLTAAGAGQVSRDGRIAFADVQYTRKAQDLGSAAYDRLDRALAPARSPALEVSARGQVVDVATQQTAPIGEILGLAAAILILTLVFRSVVAMTITLVASVLAVVAGLMLLRIGAATTTVPSVAPTLGAMLGLGAGIDYALLVTARYRERLAAGEDRVTAAGHANATAGMSVVTAGAIVVVAISGLLATGIPFVGKMGLATAVVVATVAVGAVTLLPALLSAAARRLTPPPEPPTMPWSGRWAARVGRRPVPYALAGAALLIALAIPVTGLRLGMPDDGNQPAGTTQRIAYDRIAEGFGPGVNATILVAAAHRAGDPAAAPALAGLRRALRATPGVAAVTPPRASPSRDAAILSVVPRSAPQAAATADLVRTLRDDVVPAAVRGTPVRAYVGGATATLQDSSDRVAARLPVFIAAVVGLSLLLLILVFRSLWVPAISAVFNLLSVSAAYGVVVTVFQHGVGGSLLGLDGEVPVVSFVPLFMFALLFGLSMDYNVFLQSRIHEEYRRGVGARASVVRGLAATGRVISAAGAIMVLVFLGFVFDDDVIVKMMGVGLATAILVDVLVVRMLLAPAIMFLLGDRAWWLPGRLDRLLPVVHLDGEVPEGVEWAQAPDALPPADPEPEAEPAAAR